MSWLFTDDADSDWILDALPASLRSRFSRRESGRHF
jgi:hypothetical protein